MSERETLASLRAERDDLSERLSHLLCDLTGSRLSKPTYDVRTMVQAIEEHFDEQNDTLHAEAEESQVRLDLLNETRAALAEMTRQRDEAVKAFQRERARVGRVEELAPGQGSGAQDASDGDSGPRRVEYAVVDGFCDGDNPDETDGYMTYDTEQEGRAAAATYGGRLFVRYVTEWRPADE